MRSTDYPPNICDATSLATAQPMTIKANARSPPTARYPREQSALRPIRSSCCRCCFVEITACRIGLSSVMRTAFVPDMSIERTTSEDGLKSTSRSANFQGSRLHRRDIEGLRAIAVLSVVMNHAGITKLSSGFLGVDVFFVISGYLIFKDLSPRSRAGTSAPFEFYGRRVRRTFPALCFVVIISFAVSAFLLMPGDFVAAARSGASALLASRTSSSPSKRDTSITTRAPSRCCTRGVSASRNSSTCWRHCCHLPSRMCRSAAGISA
jgi:hypothetical protein